jgi:hypothetical protein
MLCAVSAGRRDTGLQWREAVTPGAALTLGYVRRDDAKVKNAVWQAQVNLGAAEGRPTARSGPGDEGWTGSLTYARSDDRNGKKRANGDRWSVTGGYAVGGLRARVRRGETSPTFLARNGLTPSVGVRETESLLSWSGHWKSGPIRQCSVFAGRYDADRTDGTFYRSFENYGINLRTADGISLRLNSRPERFQKYADNVTTAAIILPAVGPFQSVSLRYAWGMRRGADYRFLSPALSLRCGPKCTLAASYQTVRQAAATEYLNLNLIYDLRNRESVAVRIARRNGDLAWYLTLRQNGTRTL